MPEQRRVLNSRVLLLLLFFFFDRRSVQSSKLTQMHKCTEMYSEPGIKNLEDLRRATQVGFIRSSLASPHLPVDTGQVRTSAYLVRVNFR